MRRFRCIKAVLGAVWLLLALTPFGWPTLTGAQTTPVAEYALKSALLFKLPQFVYLPDAGRAQMVDICALGSHPFGNAPEVLANRQTEGRVVRWRVLGSSADAADCDFVFIARSETVGLDATLRRLSKWPLVTVSDIEGFATQGGMVELALASDRASLNILINRKAAQKQGVEFNAQLLRLAKVIEP